MQAHQTVAADLGSDVSGNVYADAGARAGIEAGIGVDVDVEARIEQPPRPLDPARGSAALERWLRKLAKVFDLDAVRGDALDVAGVVHYYEQNHAAYRRWHSSEGAVHMALNADGRFDAEGFSAPLRRIEARWLTQAWPAPPRDVLELAFGQGYNLGYLVPRHEGKSFQGIDLTPAHVALARKRLAAWPAGRVQLMQGDFHQLPQPGASIDAAYCIESMCHATDLPRALGEVARVLRPGGELTLFDGYLPRPVEALSPREALAVELVARGLAVPLMQTVNGLVHTARAAGLQLEHMQVLDREILPNLARLERLTGAVIRWPWFGRRALARRPAARSRNVLAGCLMRTTFSMGLISYREVIFKKAP